MAKKVVENKALMIGAMILLGLFIAFLLNNFTTEGVYEIGSCTYNQHSCEFETEAWDGACTDEITDQCCADIRKCGGQVVENPMECGIYYCKADENLCFPQFNIATTTYNCECKNFNDVNFN